MKAAISAEAPHNSAYVLLISFNKTTVRITVTSAAHADVLDIHGNYLSCFSTDIRFLGCARDDIAGKQALDTP
jgi:hypothetical protein